MKLFKLTIFTAIALTLTFSSKAIAQSSGHAEHQHDSNHAGVNDRGDKVMGFSHEKTVHHFLLTPDGGLIVAEVRDKSDTASLEQVRTHFKHIAQKFGTGDFTAPMLIHDKVPPGVPAMKQMKSEIKYQFEQIDLGGRVRITTSNAKALAAIHEFLRFQISDHQTGDPGKIEKH